MGIKEYFDTIADLTAHYLEKNGYNRSGKSAIFYKYNENKSKGYLIGFRKSIDNTPDVCLFHIKFGNVSVEDLSKFGIFRNTVRLQDLKMMLMNSLSFSDYSHELNDFIIDNENVNDYFEFNILPELKNILDQNT